MGPGSDIRAVTFEDAAAVTLSDTVDQYHTNAAAGFICSGAGTVTITTARGSKVAVPVLGGVVYYIAWQRMWVTGTTNGLTILALIAHPYEGVK